MSIWRFISTDRADAAEGLATDEALMAGYARGVAEQPTALRLYTYADHAALCGRYQHLRAEIDLEACERTGTTINRRPTGGGAIVMGEGQLGLAVIGRAPVSQHPKDLLLELSQGIVAGLAKLGIDAEFAGKNDLKVDGRKIAGLGLYLDGEGGMLFHSSVLADLDIGFMLDVLDTPASKLGQAGVDAVAERITTVSRETGERWDGARLREIVALGFAESLDIDLVESALTDDEQSRADDLAAAKYRTDEWRFQRSPRSDTTASAVMRTSEGVLRLYLSLNGDTIKSALFTGDVNEIPAPLAEFEASLKWTRATETALTKLADRTLGDGRGLGIEPGLVIRTVLDAVAAANERAVAAPEREGSCYFPENEAPDRLNNEGDLS
jgi:lipoate---protein ligase